MLSYPVCDEKIRESTGQRSGDDAVECEGAWHCRCAVEDWLMIESPSRLTLVSPASRFFFFFFFFLVRGEEKKTTSGDFSQVFVGRWNAIT